MSFNEEGYQKNREKSSETASLSLRAPKRHIGCAVRPGTSQFPGEGAAPQPDGTALPARAASHARR